MIIRAYEAYGKRTCTKISLGFEVREVSEVDMMEWNELEKMEVADNSFRTTFRPYEIKTFRVSR